VQLRASVRIASCQQCPAFVETGICRAAATPRCIRCGDARAGVGFGRPRRARRGTCCAGPAAAGARQRGRAGRGPPGGAAAEQLRRGCRARRGAPGGAPAEPGVVGRRAAAVRDGHPLMRARHRRSGARALRRALVQCRVCRWVVLCRSVRRRARAGRVDCCHGVPQAHVQGPAEAAVSGRIDLALCR